MPCEIYSNHCPLFQEIGKLETGSYPNARYGHAIRKSKPSERELEVKKLWVITD